MQAFYSAATGSVGAPLSRGDQVLEAPRPLPRSGVVPDVLRDAAGVGVANLNGFYSSAALGPVQYPSCRGGTSIWPPPIGTGCHLETPPHSVTANFAMANWTRLVRFIAKETNKVHIGQPVDEAVDVGLAVLSKSPVKVYEISGSSALDSNAKVTKKVLTVKKLLSPLDPQEVGIVRCLGLNYKDHAAETKMALPKAPILFYKPSTALINPNEPIMVPLACQPPEEHLSDYEVELVVVLSKTGRDIKEEDALDYVLGYTAGNDVSFRKHQFATPQWGFSKSFDASAPMGPVLVSSKAIKDPQALPLKTTLNGETLQNGTTKDQIFGVAHTIAYLSQGTTLTAGSVIYTGTPAGVGFTKKPPIVLKHGDDVRVWVGSGIGTLVSSVEEEGKGKVKAKL